MKKVSLLLLVSSFLIFSGCDDLGVDPDVSIADCLTQGDVNHYEMFIANEKEVGVILLSHGLNPTDVSADDRQAVYDELTALNDTHDDLRRGFECQYWGEDNSFLDDLGAENGAAADPDFLDPAVFKSIFKVESENVLTKLSQEDWVGKDVYVFPGISRVPWEGSSQTNKEEAINRINIAYNEVREKLGLVEDVQLFDPVTDYLYPHATFHQQFVTAYTKALIAPDDQEKKDLVEEMLSVEERVIEKIIERAPDSIEL